jgi:Arc/MetJ family transcription regulator
VVVLVAGREHLDINQLAHHDVQVRTTLTIDDDVAAKLKKVAQRGRLSFKEAVNATLRRGLGAQAPAGRKTARVRVETFRSAFRSGVDPLKLNQLLDELETRPGRGR